MRRSPSRPQSGPAPSTRPTCPRRSRKARRYGPGKLVQLGTEGTAAKRAFAKAVSERGYHVETRFGLEGVDLVVDGVEWEYKEIREVGKNTLKEALEDAVDRKGGRESSLMPLNGTFLGGLLTVLTYISIPLNYDTRGH
jgi:hypothetical protein